MDDDWTASNQSDGSSQTIQFGDQKIKLKLGSNNALSKTTTSNNNKNKKHRNSRNNNQNKMGDKEKKEDADVATPTFLMNAPSIFKTPVSMIVY